MESETTIATCERSRQEASSPLSATLDAYPIDAGTQDRNSTACRFARARRTHVVIRTADMPHTPVELAAKRKPLQVRI
jgi:hypothetical protein